MLSKIGDLLKKKERQLLVENFFALSVLQMANYILPLITLPYLVRVIGPSGYGKIAFASSFVIYFKVLTDYGFNFTATREISVVRDDKDKLSSIYSVVMSARLILLLICFFILNIVVLSVPDFRCQYWLFVFSFGTVVGSVCFPEWFFQGIEKMKYITIQNVVTKLFFTIMVFFVVRNRDDFLFVPLVSSIGFILAGCISLWMIRFRFGVSYILPSIHEIKQTFRQGFSNFLTDFIPNLYNNSTVFILGLFTNSQLVGMYSVGIKVIDLANSLVYIVARVFYPYLNRNFTNHKMFSIIIICIGLIISLLLFGGSNLIVNVLLTAEFDLTKQIIQILAFSPFLISIILCYGTNYLLIIRKDRLYMLITVFASVLGFLGAIVFVKFFAAIGAAINLTGTRLLLACLVFIMYLRFSKQRETYKQTGKS